MTVTVDDRPKITMKPNTGPKTKLKIQPTIERAVQDRIGRQLRAMYDELLRQPLPETLIAPLRAADAAEQARARREAMLSPPLRPAA